MTDRDDADGTGNVALMLREESPAIAFDAQFHVFYIIDDSDIYLSRFDIDPLKDTGGTLRVTVKFRQYQRVSIISFMQPLMRQMRICFTDVFLFFYFLLFAFSIRHKNTRQLFSGTAERIFMKLLPNDSGENGVCIAVPKWGLGPRLILGAKSYTLCTWW